jgi:hypothetical protein
MTKSKRLPHRRQENKDQYEVRWEVYNISQLNILKRRIRWDKQRKEADVLALHSFEINIICCTESWTQLLYLPRFQKGLPFMLHACSHSASWNQIVRVWHSQINYLWFLHHKRCRKKFAIVCICLATGWSVRLCEVMNNIWSLPWWVVQKNYTIPRN